MHLVEGEFTRNPDPAPDGWFCILQRDFQLVDGCGECLLLAVLREIDLDYLCPF